MVNCFILYLFIYNSSTSGSINFVDYLKKKLDAVDRRLFDLEYGSRHSDKDSMDLKTTKNALDQHKVSLIVLLSQVSQSVLVTPAEVAEAPLMTL